jgi:hypothetical protein
MWEALFAKLKFTRGTGTRIIPYNQHVQPEGKPLQDDYRMTASTTGIPGTLENPREPPRTSRSIHAASGNVDEKGMNHA